jgi:hypothetical protein
MADRNVTLRQVIEDAYNKVMEGIIEGLTQEQEEEERYGINTRTIDAAALQEGDLIATKFDKYGKATKFNKVRKLELPHEHYGSCRGVHVNSNECYDGALGKVQVKV